MAAMTIFCPWRHETVTIQASRHHLPIHNRRQGNLQGRIRGFSLRLCGERQAAACRQLKRHILEGARTLRKPIDKEVERIGQTLIRQQSAAHGCLKRREHPL